MKILRQIGSLAFVLGLFTVIFIGMPWHVTVSEDPVVPWWLRVAIYCILGGVLLVLLTVALELKKSNILRQELEQAEFPPGVLALNCAEVPGRKITEVLGIVQGHTIFAIWLGKDLSALVRLVVGGELTEYAEMMGNARKVATHRMIAKAKEMGADAVINVRYTTTSVIGSAAELLVYATAVKLST